jgi:hypothetical protein
MRQKREPVPYASATSGAAARDEITRMLRRFGCDSVGFMDDFDKHEVLLAFNHRGRQVQLRASARGWAAMFLRAKPWNSRRRTGSRVDYERRALMQGLVAVNSILRDWVKGQLTAVECGMMQFEAVFMPYMLTGDGRTLIERVAEAKMLPAPSTRAA